MLDIRPILYYLDIRADGTRSSFGAWVNPVLCWGGLLSLLVLGFRVIKKHDRKAGFLLIAYLAQLIPWIFVTRVVFEYHYFPCSVFLVLSMGYIFETMREDCKTWKLNVFAFTALSVLVFIMFMPTLKGSSVDIAYANEHFKWLSSWPF